MLGSITHFSKNSYHYFQTIVISFSLHLCAYVQKGRECPSMCVKLCVFMSAWKTHRGIVCLCVCLLPRWWWREQCGSADEMRLKPVRGSIRGKTSDGYTATASNNEISPEVEQRAGEHICECVCVFVCKCVLYVWTETKRDEGGKRGNEEGWGQINNTYRTFRSTKGIEQHKKKTTFFSSIRHHDAIISIRLSVEISEH